MKLYLECSMGASGDMLMASLYELLSDKRVFQEKMEQLKLPGVTIEYTPSTKCGITGTHITVKVGGIEEKSEDMKQGDRCSASHPVKQNTCPPASSLEYQEALDLIQNLELPAKVLENAHAVYRMIGEAEATVHRVAVDTIHMHELGSLDAVADVVGCCLLIDMLGIEEISASPVHVGSGTVRCEHGELPVPAPAAAELLKGIPVYGGRIEGELCTPTGAALLKRLVSRFGEMPQMSVQKIGYGMGSKDFPAANCVRAFLYDDKTHDPELSDIVYEISCNLDDMTPEAVSAAFDILLATGALDVFATPITMKKSRPAITLTCLSAEDKLDEHIRLMLEHTSTLGLRIKKCHRSILRRTIETVLTKYGKIRFKRAEISGTYRIKPEYEDVLAAAKQHRTTFEEVHNEALYKAKQGETQ